MSFMQVFGSRLSAKKSIDTHNVTYLKIAGYLRLVTRC